MALGFTFTEYDEWRILVNMERAKMFMKSFGRARDVKNNHFADASKMVELLRIGKKQFSEATNKNHLAPKEDMTRNPMWKRIRGIKGYMFAIVDDELKCINALTENETKPYIDKGISRFTLFNQYPCDANKSCSYSVLKLAFCLKYNLSYNDSRLLGKRFKGTVEEPQLKNKETEKLLWDILHNQE